MSEEELLEELARRFTFAGRPPVTAMICWSDLRPLAATIVHANGFWMSRTFAGRPAAYRPAPAPPPRQPVPPTPAPSFDEEEADEVLQALDNAGGRRLDSAAIAGGVGRPCDQSLFGLLVEMVRRDLLDFEHGKGYARSGQPQRPARKQAVSTEEEEDEAGDDAPLTNEQLAERIREARSANANGHAVNLD